MLETLVRHLDMVRLTVATAMFALVAGCTGLIDDGTTGGGTPAEKAARAAWVSKAQPALTAATCTSCHAGARADIDFLTGTDALGQRDRLLEYSPAVVNLDAPPSSRILTKGPHEGPPLNAEQASPILEWVELEREAAAPAPGEEGPALETEAIAPLICTAGLPGEPTCPINTISLDKLIPGASLTFVAQSLVDTLYLTNLKLIPGPQGAFIEHPLFVSRPDNAKPVPDQIDRFFAVKMNLAMTATPEEQQIAGGSAAFVGFVPTDNITILFRAASVFKDETPTPAATGCKVLASFKTNAQALFNTNVGGAAQNCGSCHRGSNPNATSAMDIRGVETAADATIKAACDQIRTRVNFQTVAQSSIFLAPDPANNNHPFKFTLAQLTTFRNGITQWITAEQAAP